MSTLDTVFGMPRRVSFICTLQNLVGPELFTNPIIFHIFPKEKECQTGGRIFHRHFKHGGLRHLTSLVHPFRGMAPAPVTFCFIRNT